MEHTKKKGRLVVISGPSGAGKSTICAELVRKTGAFLSVSATTRSKSEKEVNGRDYWFVSRKEFEEKLAKSEFLEYAEVFGNYYGTPKEPVCRALAQGSTVLLEIDVQGAGQIKKIYPDTIMIFILPPTQADLAKRMTQRARGEDEETSRKRLGGSAGEIEAARRSFQHHVVNADLENAIEEIRKIIEQNYTLQGSNLPRGGRWPLLCREHARGYRRTT